MNLQKKSVRRMIYFVVIVGLILLMVGGSYLVYAAMTATDKKENDFLIGQVETKIEEVFTKPTTIEPNVPVPKDVKIKNTGTINQFVRVMVLPEVRASVAGDPANKQVLSLVVGTDLELINLDTGKWRDGGDGYFYYIKEAVEPDKRTDSLFESVQLSTTLSDRYHDAEISLFLKVETINCNEAAYRQAWWGGITPTAQPLKAIDDALAAMNDQ